MTSTCGAPGTVTGPLPPSGAEMRSGAGGAFQGRESYLQAAAAPDMVPLARRCTRHALAAWGLGSIADAAELVVSELVTNGVAASSGMQAAACVVLYLAADAGRLYVVVWDCCPDLPVQRGHDDDAERGRGIEIVAALADRWGACALDQGGKVTWPGSAWTACDRPG